MQLDRAGVEILYLYCYAFLTLHFPKAHALLHIVQNLHRCSRKDLVLLFIRNL